METPEILWIWCQFCDKNDGGDFGWTWSENSIKYFQVLHFLKSWKDVNWCHNGLFEVFLSWQSDAFKFGAIFFTFSHFVLQQINLYGIANQNCSYSSLIQYARRKKQQQKTDKIKIFENKKKK